ncbi:MAG: ADP-ribosylglycohydrolase family protein [Thermomicrobiales bacterium]
MSSNPGRILSTAYAGPAVRAIPVAMVHSLSDMNVALLTREVLRSALITDANPEVVNGGLALAHAVRLVLRQEIPLQMLIDEVLSLIDEDTVAQRLRLGTPARNPVHVADVAATALHSFVLAGGDLEQALAHTVQRGGAAHLTGAIAGALCGAFAGASTIRQDLIDGLEGRAYVLMAAPALLRAAQLRAGLVFQLHLR